MSTATDLLNAAGDSQNNNTTHDATATTQTTSPLMDRILTDDPESDPSVVIAAAVVAAPMNLDIKPTTSATAYSFTGNDLKKDDAATSATPTTAAGDKAQPDDDEDKRDDSMYECNICLDIAKDAVVSMCGHLFCWPCLHQWLLTRPNRKLCPVCKAGIDKDKVIPLYGRNSTTQEDPRNKVPPRPAGQRSEPQQTGFSGFSFDGFHMSFGIGAFPFGYFASSFNFGEPRPAAANRGTMQYEDEQELSKLFLYLAFLCIVWLLFA